jgi:glucokinase
MTTQPVFAGIDIGGTTIKFGLVNAEGKVLYREQRPTMAEKGPKPLMHLVTNIGERLLYFAAEEDLEVKHVGVGTPGAVNFKTGKVVGPSPNIEGWQGTEIGVILEDRLNTPVFVDNDVNAMALAEARFGAAHGASSVICVTVGTGVGGALLFNGKLWRGSNWSAGEIGHMSINFDAAFTHGGMPGSIEGYCSSQAILGRLRTTLERKMTPVFEEILEGSVDNLTIRKMFSAINKGDELAQRVLYETADYLGIGLAGVVNLVNPEVIVLGGGISDGGGGFLERTTQKIRELAFDSAVEKLRVVKASLGNDAGFIGASLLGELAS